MKSDVAAARIVAELAVEELIAIVSRDIGTPHS